MQGLAALDRRRPSSWRSVSSTNGISLLNTKTWCNPQTVGSFACLVALLLELGPHFCPLARSITAETGQRKRHPTRHKVRLCEASGAMTVSCATGKE